MRKTTKGRKLRGKSLKAKVAKASHKTAKRVKNPKLAVARDNARLRPKRKAISPALDKTLAAIQANTRRREESMSKRSARSKRAAITRTRKAAAKREHLAAMDVANAPLVIGVIMQGGVVDRIVTNDAVLIARLPRVLVIDHDSDIDGDRYQFGGERVTVSDTAHVLPCDELLALDRRFREVGPDFPVDADESAAHDHIHEGGAYAEEAAARVQGALSQHGAAVEVAIAAAPGRDRLEGNDDIEPLPDNSAASALYDETMKTP